MGTMNAKYAPGVTVYNNQLWLIYAGMGFDTYLYYANYDGTTWYGNERLPQLNGSIPQAGNSMGLSVFNGNLWCVYPGASGDLYYVYYDGTDWYGNEKISISGGGTPNSSSGVITTVYNNQLWVLFPGDSGDIYYATYDGSSWYGNQTLPSLNGGTPATSNSPGLAVFNDMLCTLYPGQGDLTSGKLYYTWQYNYTWSGNQEVPSVNGGTPASNASPGMVAFNGQLWAIFTGANTETLYYLNYDGSDWYGNAPIPQIGGSTPSSAQSAGVTVFNNQLWAIFPGTTGALNSVYYDGSDWYGNTTIDAGAVVERRNLG